MNISRKVYLCVLFSLFLILCILPSGCQDKNKITIYRDNWGIPHIFAQSEAALSYAYGYAQAEDRLIQLLTNYRFAEGTMAEVFGEGYLESDLTQMIWQNALISSEHFHDLDCRSVHLLKSIVVG